MPAGSSPLAGSSRMRSAGSFSSAAAKPSRCFIPSEYVRNGLVARSARPTRSSTSSTRRRGMRSIPASSSRFDEPREVREELRRLDHRPDPADRRRQPVVTVAPEQLGPPRARPHQAEQAADGRGLARAVRAEEPEHPALGNAQVEPVHRDRAPPPAAVLLAQPLDLDDGHRGGSLRSAARTGTGRPRPARPRTVAPCRQTSTCSSSGPARPASRPASRPAGGGSPRPWSTRPASPATRPAATGSRPGHSGCSRSSGSTPARSPVTRRCATPSSPAPTAGR